MISSHSPFNLRSLWLQIPRQVWLFLGKALLLFVVWKMVYVFWLYPGQELDNWLVKTVGQHATMVLNGSANQNNYSDLLEPAVTKGDVSGPGLPLMKSQIYFRGKRVLGIMNGCNGLELMALYVGFIICFTGPWLRKLGFIAWGILAIHVVNVLRCVFLVLIMNSTLRPWFDLAHHYVFTILVYGFVFLLWHFYVKGIVKTEKRNVAKA